MGEWVRARTDGKKNYYLYMCAQQRTAKKSIESLFLRLYVRIHIYKLKNIFIEGCAIFFFSFLFIHSLSVYPLGTNNISLTGFSFGIWNENLQKLWNIYIFFFWPHLRISFLFPTSFSPFSFFFSSSYTFYAVLESPMAYDESYERRYHKFISSFSFSSSWKLPTRRWFIVMKIISFAVNSFILFAMQCCP